MNTFKTTYLKIAVIAITTLFYCCTYTQSYTPQLNPKQASLLDSIKSKYNFQDIELTGKKQAGSGGNATSLTVKLINGKDIPTDDVQMTAIAKTLGTQIKSALKNPKEFDSYEIIFDKREVSGSMTNDNFVGHEFKADEL